MSTIQSTASVIVPSSDVSLSAGGGEAIVATPALAQFIAMLSSASESQAADILCILDRGLPLWTSRKEAAEASEVAPVADSTPVKPKKEKAAKAPAAPKKEKPAPAALPEADGDAPDASDYRVAASAIDEEVCVGRNLKGGEDKRWKPIVFRESQCAGKLVEGSDLCAKCTRRQEKYAADPKPGDWSGRVTEEPLEWVHMLGTEWAEEKKPKVLGVGASGASSVAESAENASVQEEMPVAAAAPKPVAAATKAAEKAAEKAAKAAEKEAEKAAKLAEKEAAKAAKLAEKEAAAAAKAAAKPAAKPKAAPKSKVEAKKAEAEPVAVEGVLKLIDGTLYMVKSGNVYDYDELAEKAGDFVGRLTTDETIDADAEEVTAEESDSE